MGIDLKTNKETKNNNHHHHHLPLKQRIKHKVRAGFPAVQTAHECLCCLCSRIVVILDSTQEISWVFKDSWQHRVVKITVRKTRLLSEKLPN